MTDRRGSTPLFLEPGQFVLSGPGGKDVGAFRVSFTVPSAFQWINRDQIEMVDRSRELTLRWKGTEPGRLMLIVARNVDQLTTAIGMALCVERASAGQFTIPPALLANIPASRDIPGTPFDEVALGSLAAKAVPIKASGLHGGFVVSVYASARLVEFH